MREWQPSDGPAAVPQRRLGRDPVQERVRGDVHASGLPGRASPARAVALPGRGGRGHTRREQRRGHLHATRRARGASGALPVALRSREPGRDRGPERAREQPPALRLPPGAARRGHVARRGDGDQARDATRDGRLHPEQADQPPHALRLPRRTPSSLQVAVRERRDRRRAHAQLLRVDAHAQRSLEGPCRRDRLADGTRGCRRHVS
mmetsp:Transcript_29117/g.65173  ORF Transcript_29117/g.65173 Transcript_29117/m.65173 type:complete len:206 (-) Transcript_29117:392-1009(-)